MLLARSKNLLEETDYNQLLQELDAPLRSSFRVNPLKVKQAFKQYSAHLADRYQWVIEPIPYCNAGWWINQGETPPGQTWEHRDGRYYIQDASSMLPVELFNFENSPKAPLILDLAASPGGKTTHIVSKTGDNGLVVANDASRDRITALRMVLQNWGSIAHAITQFPGEKFGAWYPETFDKVLLDAPCSMQNLRSTEARTVRSISDREEQNLANRQRKLLESALHAAKVGGEVVYATCTLMPEEVEVVVDWWITKYAGQVRIVDVMEKLPVPAPGLLKDETHNFDPAVEHAVRVWPHRMSSSGFFCAKLEKLGTTPTKKAHPATYDIYQTGFSKLPAEQEKNLSQFFITNFDFDLEKIIEEHELTLWTFKQQIIAFPERYFSVFGNLPLRSLGLPVATIDANGFLPEHHWISRFYSELNLPAVQLDEDWLPGWSNGEDLPQLLPGVGTDEIILLKDNFNGFLGVGKQQKDRIKNLLPRRMVL